MLSYGHSLLYYLLLLTLFCSFQLFHVVCIGKTLCYALPIVHSLQKMHPKIEVSSQSQYLITHMCMCKFGKYVCFVHLHCRDVMVHMHWYLCQPEN